MIDVPIDANSRSSLFDLGLHGDFEVFDRSYLVDYLNVTNFPSKRLIRLGILGSPKVRIRNQPAGYT